MGTRGVSLPPITLATRDSLEIQVLAQTFWHVVALYCLSEHPKHICCLFSNSLEFIDRLSSQDRLMSVFGQSHFDNPLLPVQVLVCRVFQVPKVFQEKRVLWVPVDLLVLPNLVLQDPGVPQGPKVFCIIIFYIVLSNLYDNYNL